MTTKGKCAKITGFGKMRRDVRFSAEVPGKAQGTVFSAVLFDLEPEIAEEFEVTGRYRITIQREDRQS